MSTSIFNTSNILTSTAMIVIGYLAIKLVRVIRMFYMLRSLPQKPSNWFMGHLDNLLPPPFTSNNQFGQGLKKCIDKLESFLHENGYMVFWVSWFPIIVVTDPDILVKLTASTIEKGPGPDVAKLFFGDGLVVQKFRKWKVRRRILAPAFHHAAIASYLPIISRIAHNRVNNLIKSDDNNNNKPINGELIDTKKFTQETGMDITCEITLGIASGTEGSPGWQYRKSIDVALEMMLIKAINPLYWSNFLFFHFTDNGKRSKQAADYIHSFPASLIQARQQTHVTGSIDPNNYNPAVRFNLLDYLLDLHLQCKVGKQSFQLSVADITEEINNALFAGNETTAGTTAWTMFHLATNPDIQSKVYSELVDNGFIEKEFIDYSEETLKSLKYLECCIKETLRLCPPIHTITRRLDEDLMVNHGQVIPKGSVIALSIFYIHRNPKFWPQPKKYIPDRFEGDKGADRPSLAYIPFGFGSRQCVGQKLAIREIKVILAEVLRRFSLVSYQSFDNIETAFLSTYRPVENLKVEFRPRLINRNN